MAANLFRFMGSVLVLVGVAALTACEKAPAPLSDEAIATRDALPKDVFRGELGGKPMYLLLHRCEVYSVTPKEKGEVEWESVLALEFYPFGSSCDRQSMEYKDGALTVRLGRTAFGAGGCCIRSGTFRSTDGRNWKKISDNSV